MKGKDIEVGKDYAYVESQYGTGMRVRIVAPAGSMYPYTEVKGWNDRKVTFRKLEKGASKFHAREARGKVLVHKLCDDGSELEERAFVKSDFLATLAHIKAPWDEFIEIRDAEEKLRKRHERAAKEREAERRKHTNELLDRLEALGVLQPTDFDREYGKVNLNIKQIEMLVKLAEGKKA